MLLGTHHQTIRTEFVDKAMHVPQVTHSAGEITVGELICSGTVKGTIRTARSSEFLSPGKIEAELFTAQLRVERGVIFDGNIHMRTRE